MEEEGGGGGGGKPVIRFGSLAEQVGDAARAEQLERIGAGVAAGNIHVAGLSAAAEALGDSLLVAPEERHELTADSAQERRRQEELLAAVAHRRRARAVAVPTDDGAVRQRLRGLGEPVTLFGEGKAERRDRLRQLLAELDDADGGELAAPQGAELLEEAPAVPELFYTEGPDELADARAQIARFSLPRAARRVAEQKRKRGTVEEAEAAKARATRASEVCGRLELESSELGDERPLSDCAFSPDGGALLVGSWSGLCKLWDVGASGAAAQTRSVRAHEERVTGVAWHPDARRGLDAGAANFATASADATAKLWTAEGTELATLRGHATRLCRVAFHPSGSYLGTASFDKTWRLWDIAAEKELLCQEGHSRPVYCVAFQHDGALAVSAGLDAHCWVWDLRSGRSVWTMQGHVRQTLAADFSPDGYRVATGGGDNTVRVWDLRKRACTYTIPAHTKQVARLRFEPGAGNFLVSASYDRTAKVWSAHDFRLLRTLQGHEDKVMGVDVTQGATLVATTSYDRTVKLWKPGAVAAATTEPAPAEAMAVDA